jgi:hypothetical protein
VANPQQQLSAVASRTKSKTRLVRDKLCFVSVNYSYFLPFCGTAPIVLQRWHTLAETRPGSQSNSSHCAVTLRALSPAVWYTSCMSYWLVLIARLPALVSIGLARDHSAETATLRPTTSHRLSVSQAAFKVLVMCSVFLHIAAQTATPSPTVSPSALCAAGWSYYSDSDGSEGQASCLKVTGSSTFLWSSAMLSCSMNSHLLTMAGATRSSGLFAFTRSLTVTAGEFWVGASQSSAGSHINRGWAWIDGTSASANMNCGAPGERSCGLWTLNEPRYD